MRNELVGESERAEGCGVEEGEAVERLLGG